MRAATTRRKLLGPVAALAPLLFLLSSIFLLVSTLEGCAGPCQRNSDCPARTTCGAYGTCEYEQVDRPDPPDASDDRVHELPDGALDDSDLGDVADAGIEPDAI
jgi:hypothetical protein